MARRFVKVSDEEIEEAFFYPSDVVNTKTTTPSGSVRSGRYIPRRFTSRYVSTTIRLPLGDSFILFIEIAVITVTSGLATQTRLMGHSLLY